MSGILRKATNPIVSNFGTLILFSLWIGLFKTLIDLICSLPLAGITSATSLGMALLFTGQIATFVMRKKVAWVLSAIHTISIIFLSVGTFGYIFTYLLKPFSHHQPEQAYLLSGLLLAAEALKTYYFYRVSNK